MEVALADGVHLITALERISHRLGKAAFRAVHQRDDSAGGAHAAGTAGPVQVQ